MRLRGLDARGLIGRALPALAFLLLAGALPVLAQEGPPRLTPSDYRSFFGADSRVVMWVVAELHLMFAAFVLGVPIFAVICEAIGVKTRDSRYDRLAHEFTKLLASAFSTTAALGGLLLFILIGLYPGFTEYLFKIFHDSTYVYALLFFGEGASLYLYYYTWDRLQDRKWLHLALGIALNLFGTALMFIANGWATFMMAPRGVEAETGALVSSWEALTNPLWTPLNIHRIIANVVFGGFIVAAYAAFKYLGARSDAERAHYDWMGYLGNFIGVIALIPLPFAGYWLGREIYSASPLMGNNMMGGSFSWAFILQAILIGIIFISANYYLWVGMTRIPGSERYLKYIKYVNAILLVCFAVWLTPHNLPLSPAEQMAIGGQYHPVLKYLGLMSGKNAAVNFIILSTFCSFLLYRRANRGSPLPFASHGANARWILGGTCLVVLLMLGAYARSLFTLDPASLDLTPEKRGYFLVPAWLLLIEMGMAVLATYLTFRDRGRLAQALYFLSTVLMAVFFLGVYGYIVMTQANPFLRDIAVVQVLMVLSCLILVTAIDVFLFKGAESLGRIRWGQMPVRSQYTLVLLCVSVVMLLGLMGFIRSGLREDWHVYGILQDTSAVAFTPTLFEMGKVVGSIVVIFLGLIAFVFWLSTIGEKEEEIPTEWVQAEAAADGQ